LDDGGWFNVGDLDIEAFLIPGHAPDCMAIRAENHLLVGDYLSPCEIPFVDDLADYRRTLKRLLTLISPEIDTVIPGHGPALSAADARRIAREDLHYLDRIAHCVERNETAAALKLSLPRATEVAGMRDHHTENCRKAGLVTAGASGG
jgi:glyoxylase-like metal-dependent hydrolase (beta-lactamase superfamily II)